jgi:hypothetical protein
MRMTNSPTASRLPRRVFYSLIGISVAGAIAAFCYSALSGWTPPRAAAGFFLPLYFAVVLFVLTLSFVVSGNTLMFHYRTGTVQRATDPTWFWSIVGVQWFIALVLLIVGCVNLTKFHG